MDKELKAMLTEIKDELTGQMKSLDERLTGQMNALDERLSGQMNALDERLTGQMNALDERLTGQMNALDERLTGQMNALSDDLGELRSQVTDIQLTLENDINPRINFIADGHLDLNRKLNEALKVKEDYEMRHARMDAMESDIRMLKEKVSKIA